MHHNLITEQKSLKQSLKLFVANVGLSQLNWKTVPQLGACSSRTSITKLAVSHLMTHVLELAECYTNSCFTYVTYLNGKV